MLGLLVFLFLTIVGGSTFVVEVVVEDVVVDDGDGTNVYLVGKGLRDWIRLRLEMKITL